MFNHKKLVLTVFFTFGVAFFIAHGRATVDYLKFHDKKTIILTAKNNRFNRNNPDIVLPPQKPVRLVLRNVDQGIPHNLLIPELNLQAAVINEGETAILEFETPEEGTFIYMCSLHRSYMVGNIVIKE